jgi:hypothetical protein
MFYFLSFDLLSWLLIDFRNPPPDETLVIKVVLLVGWA